MKILEKDYKSILVDPRLPSELKEELRSQALQDQWVFVGSDF